MKAMKRISVVVCSLLFASYALAGEADLTAPPDPEVTLKTSEIQALINLGVAAVAAQSAQNKIHAATAPKPMSNEAPADKSK